MDEMDEEQKRITKEAIKEGIEEWLDKKYSEWGKFSLHALLAAGLVALTYFILRMDGWHK